MSNINFRLNWAFTPLSNIFIEEYMTMPNYPVYSLVYIYALKKAMLGEDIDNASIAEHFQIMESEVAKIWQYWEKSGLIKTSTQNGVTNIEYLTPNSRLIKPVMQKTTDVPKLRRENKPIYNPEDIRKISEQDEEISGLLSAAEQLLNKPLSPNDINTIVSFYDWLGLPIEVIYVLLSYCGTHGKGMRYMEKTAIDWADKGINDQDAAEDYLNIFLNEYKKIMRFYGITDRMPTPDEQAFMSNWVKKLNMPLDVIKEACSRTVKQTGRAIFSYTDKIISNWHNAGLLTIEQIKQNDKEYSRKKAAVPTSATGGSDFDQRHYDEETLEKIFDRKRNE